MNLNKLLTNYINYLYLFSEDISCTCWAINNNNNKKLKYKIMLMSYYLILLDTKERAIIKQTKLAAKQQECHALLGEKTPCCLLQG